MSGSVNCQRIRSGLNASTSRASTSTPSQRPFTRPSPAPVTKRIYRIKASQQDQGGSFWPESTTQTSSSNGQSPGSTFFPEATKTTTSASPATATSTIAATPTPGSDGDVLIEFKNVYKSFGSKSILKGATFKIRRGEAVGIIGSSGTGKSTTLRLAAGLLQPDSGEILIKGEARQGLLSDDDTSDKLKVGLVFQSGALFDSLSVKENVGFMLYEHTDLPEPAIEAAVAQSLAQVGLSGVENLYPSELSGGMKKRVALARAIVSDATEEEGAEQLIMYDEPTAGLDPVASTVIEDLIRSLHDPDGNGKHAALNGGGGGGITSYVVVTHQHTTIRRAVDRIIFLNDGMVVWEGTVAEFDSTDEPIVRQFASGSLDGPIVYV